MKMLYYRPKGCIYMYLYTEVYTHNTRSIVLHSLLCAFYTTKLVYSKFQGTIAKKIVITIRCIY